MKNFTVLLFAFLLSHPALLSQKSEETWEQRGERIAEKAERIAERAERQAERTAENLESRAEAFGRGFERKWDRKWRRAPRAATVSFCPETAYLGIEASDVSKEKARKLGFENFYGSYVSKVKPNTEAAKAGLQPFDYIYGVDEQRTSDNQSLRDILEDFEEGSEVTLHLVRKGQKQTVKVKLENLEQEEEDWNESERAFLGVSADEDDEQDEMNGVKVNIVGNSTAQAMGLQDGDRITGINGYPVLDWSDVETAVGNTKPGEEIEVVFKRGGTETNAKAAIKSYEEAYPDDDGENGNDGGNWNWNSGEEDEEGGADDEDFGDDRGFLGIYAEQVSEEKARKLGFDNPHGSYVTGVLKNSAAERAGIMPFDYIYGVDEYRVGENQSLSGILTKFKPGDKGTVHFIRKGKKTTADATFGKQSEAKKTSRNSCEDPFFGIDQIGDESEGSDGVKIFPVDGSTAADMGLKSGDVILTINGYKMLDWTDVETGVEMLKPGETITVEYRRDGQVQKGSKPIKSYAETKKCKDCDCGEEHVIVNVNPSWNSAPKAFGRSAEPSRPRLDLSKTSITMEDASGSDMSTLQAKGVEMPSSNSLAVEHLTLSPNPSKGMFKLEFNLPTSGSTVVRVFNTSGRTIYEYELGKFSGSFSDDVDISQNGAGSYFLQVTQDGKAFVKKIVLAEN